MPDSVFATGAPPLSGPYPERHEASHHRLDRWLLAGAEWTALRAAGRARALAREVPAVLALGDELRPLSDAALLERADALRAPLLRDGLRRATVTRAFALVREACRRHLGIVHHPVQLMGGFALLRGMLAEMATGEGKTISAALAAATAGLCGLPVHVVTVNDYLAERDGTDLAPVYAALGLSTGIVRHGQDAAQRARTYARDVVYAANKELAFDYLRDRLAIGRRRARADVAVRRLEAVDRGPLLLLRGLGFALIDEADSVLVDEARTPLIISAPEESAGDAPFRAALALAGELAPDADFVLQTSRRHVALTAAGRVEVDARAQRFEGLPPVRRARHELVEHALSALHLFRRDEHYLVADGKVQIVDEFTGRIAEGRAWERGLHQMIEAKEDVAVTGRRDARARITYQRFFRRYLRLAGMSGTVAELAGELRAVYGLRTVRIPQNRVPARRDLGVRLFRTEAHKWRAVAAVCRRLAATGRPVLVGTRSVAASEELSRRLADVGVVHAVLNARQDREEADIIARAGEPGRITIATNMAGRGTDIRLAPGVGAAGGLHVVLTEFHESRRIDRQLIGRGGRQGDDTSTEALVSLEDELFVRFGGVLRASLSARPADADGEVRVPPRFVGWLRAAAQAAAERHNAAIRFETLRADDQFRRALAFAGLPD